MASMLTGIAPLVAALAGPLVRGAAADSRVMPQPRLSTQELVAWNREVRVVPPALWPAVDAALDEHREEAWQRAVESAVAVRPLLPGGPKGPSSLATMADLERIERRLVARLETQRALEQAFAMRLVELLGPESAVAVDQLFAARAVAVAGAMLPRHYDQPALRVPDIAALARRLDLDEPAVTAARGLRDAALPGLRESAGRLALAVAGSRASSPLPGNSPHVAPELWREFSIARDPRVLDGVADLARQLARLRRSIVQVLPADSFDRATALLFSQVAASDGLDQAISMIRGVALRMRDLDLRQRHAAVQIIDRGSAELRRMQAEHAHAAEQSLREHGRIEGESVSGLVDRMEEYVTRAKVRFGAAIGVSGMAKFMRVMEADAGDAIAALGELMDADAVESLLRELEPEVVEWWSGRTRWDPRAYEVPWSDLAEIAPIDASFIDGLVGEAEREPAEAILQAAAQRWRTEVAPLQAQVVRERDGSDIDPEKLPSLEATEASRLASMTRLDEAIRQLDDFVFASIAALGGVDPFLIGERGLSRIADRYGRRTQLWGWHSGDGAVRPANLDMGAVVAAAGLSEPGIALARLALAGHVAELNAALRERHDVAMRRAAIERSEQIVRSAIWRHLGALPEEARPEILKLYPALQDAVEAGRAALADSFLRAEARWQRALDSAREDWELVLEAGDLAAIERAYRRAAYPRLAFDGRDIGGALRDASRIAESEEQRAELAGIAARHAAERDAQLARSVAAIAAVPYSREDVAGGDWTSWPRQMIVENDAMARSEIGARAVRDAALLLGDEKLAKLSRLRGVYERSGFD
ncbi:MAG TPA: hypothetical protein PKC43_02990 [Phycisphaerales bacterium]|nr:hypothetical protein [Phycisphaerales bacterium]HMP36393.1 hypothetical protein [Phycisphaerales bacterium]